MTVIQKEHDILTIVQAAIKKHGNHRDALIPILGEVNQEIGYIPIEAIKQIRAHINSLEEHVFVSQSQIYGVASFYSLFSTEPRGRHVVQFCESAPCHVQGGRELIKALKDELKLEPGQTSPDGRWSLIMTSCLGVCAVGPVIIVDEDIYGPVTAEQLPGILAKYE
jgi:NADH:ubiquinone oxidoreductase subunit E